MTIRVLEDKCLGCCSCVLFCPEEALEASAPFFIEVDPDSCTDCLTCLDCCPNNAIQEGNE